MMPAYLKLSNVHRWFMPTSDRKTVIGYLDAEGVLVRVAGKHPVVDTEKLREKYPSVWAKLNHYWSTRNPEL